jgi:hypothetical protein
MSPRISSGHLAITRALAAALLIAVAPTALSAQGVCQEACPNALTDPAGAAACAARIATCSAKLALYQSYMGQLSLGVTKAHLTPLYVQILAPLYPSVGMNAWQFAWADRQPPLNSTTDCMITYFNPNATFANRLAQGNLTDDAEIKLLLHELTHVEQCMAAGGRDRYAKIWFGQAEFGWLQTHNLEQIHDIMPMENAANAKATTLLETTRRSRNAEGAFIPPQADLRIRSLGIFENYRAGYCTLLVGIENNGSAPIGIGYYSNSAAVVRVVSGTTSLGDFTLAQLDPQGVLRQPPPQRVTVTWRPGNLYTFNGSRSFVAQVDPNRVVSDANRTNNLADDVFSCSVTATTAPRIP